MDPSQYNTPISSTQHLLPPRIPASIQKSIRKNSINPKNAENLNKSSSNDVNVNKAIDDKNTDDGNVSQTNRNNLKISIPNNYLPISTPINHTPSYSYDCNTSNTSRSDCNNLINTTKTKNTGNDKEYPDYRNKHETIPNNGKVSTREHIKSSITPISYANQQSHIDNLSTNPTANHESSITVDTIIPIFKLSYSTIQELTKQEQMIYPLDYSTIIQTDAHQPKKNRTPELFSLLQHQHNNNSEVIHYWNEVSINNKLQNIPNMSHSITTTTYPNDLILFRCTLQDEKDRHQKVLEYINEQRKVFQREKSINEVDDTLSLLLPRFMLSITNNETILLEAMVPQLSIQVDTSLSILLSSFSISSSSSPRTNYQYTNYKYTICNYSFEFIMHNNILLGIWIKEDYILFLQNPFIHTIFMIVTLLKKDASPFVLLISTNKNGKWYTIQPNTTPLKQGNTKKYDIVWNVYNYQTELDTNASSHPASVTNHHLYNTLYCQLKNYSLVHVDESYLILDDILMLFDDIVPKIKFKVEDKNNDNKLPSILYNINNALPRHEEKSKDISNENDFSLQYNANNMALRYGEQLQKNEKEQHSVQAASSILYSTNYHSNFNAQYQEQLIQISKMQLDIHNTLNQSMQPSCNNKNEIEQENGNSNGSTITTPCESKNVVKQQVITSPKEGTSILSPILSINSSNTPVTTLSYSPFTTSTNNNATPFSSTTTISNHTNKSDNDDDNLSNKSNKNILKDNDDLDCYSIENDTINTNDDDDDSIIKRLEQKYF